MSIIDGLSDPGAVAVGLGQYVSKDAVREALTSDETARSVAVDPAVNEALRRYVNAQDNQWKLIRAVLAAAAGGDR